MINNNFLEDYNYIKRTFIDECKDVKRGYFSNSINYSLSKSFSSVVRESEKTEIEKEKLEFQMV